MALNSLRSGFFIAAMSVCAVLWHTGAGAAAGDPSPLSLLTEMRLAVNRLDYRGTVTYSKDNQVEILRVFHSVNNGVERARLLSVNSPLREVIREQGRVTCYFPESRSLTIEERAVHQPVLLSLPENVDELSRYYAFAAGNTEIVAQRPARLIAIEPRDAYRYGRLLWVDIETRLPLKYELIDEKGRILEQMVFSDLNLEKNLPDSDLTASSRPDSSWEVKHKENLPAEKLSWTLEHVPDGFRLLSYSRLKRGADKHVVDHILLNDGLSSVSVYIDELPSGAVPTHHRKVVGAINFYTRKIGAQLITVLGEVPFKTVKAIGDGIRKP